MIVVAGRVRINSDHLEHYVEVRVGHFQPNRVSCGHLDLTHHRIIRGAPMVLPVLRSWPNESNGQTGQKGKTNTTKVGE